MISIQIYFNDETFNKLSVHIEYIYMYIYIQPPIIYIRYINV